MHPQTTTIPLSGNKGRGLFATVDAADAHLVEGVRWYLFEAADGSGRQYASRSIQIDGRTRTIYMHAVIMGGSTIRTPVDHIDGNGLNNTRANLRRSTVSQNAANGSRHRRNKSGYRGVSLSDGRWMASICCNRKRQNLGRYDTPEEAARVYDAAARELFGEFARLNFPDHD